MISLGCKTSPSVPPAQVSWIVSETAETIKSEENIHQGYDGSFSTESRMQVTVPGGRKVADLVVQCVASHESLGQASVEAVHVIRVTSKSHVFSCLLTCSGLTNSTYRSHHGRDNLLYN